MAAGPMREREPGRAPPRGLRPRRFGRAVVVLAVLLGLPFLALLRGSTWLYLSGRCSTWGAVAGGTALALLAVTALGAWMSTRLTGRARVRFVATWVALPLVLVYVGQALLFFSAVNAKTEAVRSYYTSLHPLLRMAVATLVLVDGEVVVTDMAREPDDYGRMGVPAPGWSMHYRQADGWVHAMDLRTLGRSRVRNLLTGMYFRALGFRVLSHNVTAEHLHVSLPLRGAPPGAT